MSDRSGLIAVMGSHEKNSWGVRFTLWGFPAIFVLLNLIVLWHFPRPTYEYLLPNYLMFILGILFSGLAFNRFGLSLRKFHTSVLLIYTDRVIYKNLQTKISVPRGNEAEVSFEFLGGPFQLMCLRVGNYKKLLSTCRFTHTSIQRAKENGVRFIHSPRKGWVIAFAFAATLAFAFSLSAFLEKAGISPYWLVVLATLGALIQAKRSSSFQTYTRSKRFFKSLFFTRYMAQGAACFLMMFLFLLIGEQPLSGVDRKIRGVSTLLNEGRFVEANREFELLESPDRTEYFKNNYAWFLTVVPDADLRNPQKAIQLTEQAILKRNTKYIQDTLACAHMANGNVEKALVIAKERGLKDRVTLFEQHALCTDSKFASRSVASGG